MRHFFTFLCMIHSAMGRDMSYIRFGESVVSWRNISYFKIDNLGKGGTSYVFHMAATSGPNKGMTFAVKVFNAVRKEEWRLNFMREVNFLRSCDHPAILKVFDEGLYRDQFPFVVMEYLPETLSDAIKRRDLSDSVKFGHTIQLLSALAYLIRLEPPIVHRDIKPSNVFLKSTSAVLGDFGLLLQFDGTENTAKKPSSNILVPEMARNYRTPELVAYHNGGPKPSPASDVFQLGLVIAELFTGKNPQLKGAPEKAIELEPIADIPGKLGAPVKALIQSMLTKEENRPSAKVLLGQWQELYLELLRREYDEKNAERLKAQPEKQAVVVSGHDGPL